MTDLAFPGTGVMDLPMARRLNDGGFTVHADNRTAEKPTPTPTSIVDAPGLRTRAKVPVNGWMLGVVGVLAETIALAEGLGIDPQVFFDAIEGGALDLPYARLKGPPTMRRDFSDVSFALSLARKDAELVLADPEQVDLELPVMRGVLARLQRAEAEGHGDEDMGATFLGSAPHQR